VPAVFAVVNYFFWAHGNQRITCRHSLSK
jgi:hypothetical protein